MKRSNSIVSTGESPSSNRERRVQKIEVIQMLKNGKSSSSVDLHFGIGETAVRNIKKKWIELDRYGITLVSTVEGPFRSISKIDCRVI